MSWVGHPSPSQLCLPSGLQLLRASSVAWGDAIWESQASWLVFRGPRRILKRLEFKDVKQASSWGTLGASHSAGWKLALYSQVTWELAEASWESLPRVGSIVTPLEGTLHHPGSGEFMVGSLILLIHGGQVYQQWTFRAQYGPQIMWG